MRCLAALAVAFAAPARSTDGLALGAKVEMECKAPMPAAPAR